MCFVLTPLVLERDIDIININRINRIYGKNFFRIILLLEYFALKIKMRISILYITQRGLPMESNGENKKNEQTFHNMAMTFSLEGVTKDIQDILQRKMNFHVKALKELSGIVASIASCSDISIRKKLINDSDISELIQVTVNDYKVIVGSSTLLLQELLRKKDFIINETTPEKDKI
jgi:hypothetical protein